MLRQIAGFALAALVPLSAGAQTVPAIQSTAAASADGQGARAAASYATNNPAIGGSDQAPKAPPGWPPVMTAPPVPLDAKEKAAVAMATAWRNRADRPSRDPDGVLRWVAGSSQARVVCAPLEMCDVELKPGEAVNNIRLGDTAFWTVTLAISGGSDGRTTHVAISPREAGRSTSMVIYTDQRTYSLKLVSTPRDYTPRSGFTYAEAATAQQDNWASYRVAVAGGALRKDGPVMPNGSGAGGVDVSRIEMLDIKGDNPTWRPLAAYTDGRKTYIQFPAEMQFGNSPTLVGVNDDGGLFSSPTERRVIYRVQGDRLIADTVMDRMKLVLGVGSSQRSVSITRRR